MVIEAINEEKDFSHALASPLSMWYAIFIMLWTTFFHESWKRKQNFIANEWLVRNFQDVTTERADFLYEAAIDPETQLQVKVAKRDAYKIQMLVGVPVSLLFMGLVIGAQALMQKINWDIARDENDVP